MNLNFKRKEKVDVKEVNEVISLSKKILNLLYTVMIIGIILILTMIAKEWGVFTFLLNILKVVSPFIIGFIIAWLFNPLVKKMESKGIPRMIGSLIIYAIIILVIAVFIRVMIPTVYNQINELVNNIPAVATEVERFINESFSSLSEINGFDFNSIKENVLTALDGFIHSFTNNLPGMVMNIVTSLFSSVVTIVFGLVIGLYMLFDFENINGYLLKLLPKKHRFEASLLITNISSEVRKTINGTILVATMVFVCDSIGFAIVGLQAPLLFGLFCGITDLIPYVGPYIGGAAAVIVAFSQGPVVGVTVLIICVVVQLVENMILQPIVMSKTMQLNPITIIFGLLIFEHFFGIMGMIFATPCIALLKVVYKFIVEKFNLFEEKNNNVVLINEEG